MRFTKSLWPLPVLLALVACSPRKQEAPPQAAANAPAPEVPSTKPLDADAQAAQALVERYLGLIEAKNYAQAMTFWAAHGREGFQNKPELLAAQTARYSRFHPLKPDLATIYKGADPANLVVPVKAEVTQRADGKSLTARGYVYLNRPTPTAAWEITGVDIRKPAED